jgi:hypothetical protein
VEVSAVLRMPDSLFPQYCPTSAEDMRPVNRSQILIWLLPLNTVILPSFLDTIGFLGGRFPQNEGQGNTQQITQLLQHNWG